MNIKTSVALIALATAAVSAWADAPAPGAHPAPRYVLAPQKQNGSGVQLSYRVPEGTQPGQAATVWLQFSRVHRDDAQVTLRASTPEMQITLGGQAISGPISLQPGANRVLELQVTAPEGLQVIHVFTRQGGRTSAQSIALKVGQGQTKLKPNGKAQTTPSGEKVISLPSQ